MPAKAKPRTFTKEFKAQAVHLATQPDVTISQIARDIGVNNQLLGRWVKQAREAQELQRPVFTGRGNPALSEQEKRIQELERELHIVKQEREILKAAAKYFAKETK
jgi:transposase